VTPSDRDPTELSGLVLIDEIDLHLHPSWQRTVVPHLAAAFPRLQFILTSHSPIVLGTLYPDNILVMEPTAPAQQDDWPSYQAVRYQESTHGLSADQLLTGSYFGLMSTRARDAQRHLRSLADRVADGDKDAARQYLRALRTGSPRDET
jgi:hypothetical protein